MGGDIGRARCRAGLEDMAFVAELGGSHRKHLAQLAAADDSDCRAGRNHSGVSATDAVCSERCFSSRPASALSPPARIDAARSAALIAPALPMARVPTGMPAGI